MGRGAADRPEAILFDVGNTLLGFPIESWEAMDLISLRALHDDLADRADRQSWPGPVPSLDALVDAFRTSVRELHARALPSLAETPARRVLEETLRRVGIHAVGAALDRWERVWAEPRLAIRTLFPEVPLVLRTLRESGIRMGLISNIWVSGPIVREHLRALGLLEVGLFEAVVLSSEIGYVKPHPALFRTALAQMGVEASRAWYVGDDPHADVAGAKAAGMVAVLVRRPAEALPVPSPPPDDRPYDGPPPDMVIQDLREVLQEAGCSLACRRLASGASP